MIVNKKKIKIFLVLIANLAFFSCGNFLLASNSFEKDFVEEINKLKSEKLSKKRVVSDRLQKDHYLIGPGDILSLFLFDAPEFSGDYSVLNDGTVQTRTITGYSGNDVFDIISVRRREPYYFRIKHKRLNLDIIAIRGTLSLADTLQDIYH